MVLLLLLVLLKLMVEVYHNVTLLSLLLSSSLSDSLVSCNDLLHTQQPSTNISFEHEYSAFLKFYMQICKTVVVFGVACPFFLGGEGENMYTIDAEVVLGVPHTRDCR